MTDAPNEGEEDTHQHELVIIRRRSDPDEAPHKGGVWKIAHADFMTALMAFFLVMWLITATDDKTISGIANYFNPMRLSDATTRPKGVFSLEPSGEQEEEAEESGTEQEVEQKKEKSAGAKSAPVEYSETALFKDPYEALDKIAEQAPKPSPSQASQKGIGGPARHPGEAFRDPFNPDVHYGPVRPEELSKRAGKGAEGKTDEGKAAATAESSSDRSARAREKVKTSRDVDNSKGRLKRKLENLVSQSGFSAKPGIDVQPTTEGLLISITDQFDFEMFGISSARPKPELVVLMERIGRLLAKRPEEIVIRGHTDGRPFRSDAYDNWRLSTARAHMANYMLVRSGVSEERIARIEGHADHDLKVGGDPLAAPNRRIEILLLPEKKP